MNNLLRPDGDGSPDGFPSTKKLARRGVAAAGFLAAGGGLLVLGGLPLIPALIVGGLACFVGAGSAFSRNTDDRIGGGALFAGGAITLIAKLPLFGMLRPVAGFALVVGAVACLGLAVWNGIRFLRGLKARS